MTQPRSRLKIGGRAKRVLVTIHLLRVHFCNIILVPSSHQDGCIFRLFVYFCACSIPTKYVMPKMKLLQVRRQESNFFSTPCGVYTNYYCRLYHRMVYQRIGNWQPIHSSRHYKDEVWSTVGKARNNTAYHGIRTSWRGHKNHWLWRPWYAEMTYKIVIPSRTTY